MGGRPLAPLPTWATNLNYPAGSDPWSGDLLKLDPGAGLRAAGWEPEDRPGAQHQNHQFNKLGEYIDYLDAIAAQNWAEPVTIVDNTGDDIGYDKGLETWFVVGELQKVHASRDGYTWTAQSMPAGTQNLLAIAGSTSNVVAGGIGDQAFQFDGVTWTKSTLPGGGVIDVNRILSDPASFIMLGGSLLGASDAANVWRTTDGFAFTRVALPVPSFTPHQVDVMANRPLTNQWWAYSQNSNPANAGEAWTSTDGIAWTLRTPGIIRGTAAAGSFEQQLWMCVTELGFVFTSADAITWNQVASLSNITFAANCLSVSGSLWVAGTLDRTIIYSTDAGVTWRKVPWLDDVRGLHHATGRFAATTTIATSATDVHTNMALRVGDDEVIAT